MLPATTPAVSVLPPRRANGVDNRQVLEFLALVREFNELAALLAIEPAGARRRGGAHRDKRQTPA